MSDIRDRLKAAILGQESGNGTADTSQPNYAGAIGPGQIIPTTFDALKNQGLIPKDYDINNPAHNRAASGALLDHLMEKYADDPAKAAAAYYAGEKAVRPDGSVANYRDRKNPNAPTVFQYQDQVLHRMGAEYDNGTFAGSPVLPTVQTASPTLDDWSNTPGNGPKAPRAILTPKDTNDILPKADPLTGPDYVTEGLVANTKELQDETAHYDAMGIIPTAIDLAAHQGLTGVLIRAIADESHGKPQPGYVPSVVDKDLYAGRTEADHQYLDEATNHMDALRRDLAIQRKDDDLREAGTQGTATTIMASLMGGLPEGFGIGGVAARTMTIARTARAVMGARAAAEADATANLLRASQGFAALPKAAPVVAAPTMLGHFTEQALGNIGAVGVQNAFDPYVSKDDYMMAGFNTLLFTGISGIGHAFHPSDAVVARQIGQAGADDAGMKINTIRQRALDNLGPDASPEALRAEAARLEGNEVRGTITAATSAVGEDRRLIPDVETIAKDITTKRDAAAELAAADTKVEDAANSSASKQSVAAAEFKDEVVPVSNLPTVDNTAHVLTTLPAPLAKATPRFSYSKRGFGLNFASDLDKAAYIARDAAKPSKADAAYVDFVAKATGMTEAEIRAHGDTVHQTIKAQAKTAEPGVTELHIPDHAANPGPVRNVQAQKNNVFRGQGRGAGSQYGFTQPPETPIGKLFSNFADQPNHTKPEAAQNFRDAMFNRANADPKDFKNQKVESTVHNLDNGAEIRIDATEGGKTRVQVVANGEVVAAAKMHHGMIDSIASKVKGAGVGADLLHYLHENNLANIHEVPDRSPGFVKIQKEVRGRLEKPNAAEMHMDVPGERVTRVGFRSENPTFYHDVGAPRVREHLARNDPGWRANVAELGEGTTMEHIDTLPKGVHVMPAAAADPVISKVGAALKDLASHYLDKSKIIVGKIKDDSNGVIAQQAQKAGSKGVPNGAVVSAGNAHIIGIKSRNLEGAMLTGIHELGHAIFHENLANIPPKLLARMAAAHQSFIKDLAAGKASARFKRLSADVDNHVGKDGKLLGKLPDNAYAASFDEYTAEAYVRYIQDKVNSGTGPKLNAEAKGALLKVWERIKSLWDYARGKGYLGDDEPFHEFFDHVMNGSLKDADKVPVGETQYLDPGLTLDFNTHFDPAAQKIGSDLMPQKTVQQEAEAQAVVGIHKQAAAYAAKNPVNVQRLSKLLKNTVFDPISSVMLRSSNPVVRMISAELIENGAGAAGRRSTAALGKWIHEQAFMGNAINDSQKQYVEWRNLQGGNWAGDFMDGKLRATFDRMVAQEIEGRRPGATKIESPDQVIKAADVFQAAYERMRVQQTATKTTGWASLPETSVGYMPHRMSRDAVLNLTVGPEGVAKTNALHAALTDQFMGIEGFDPSFSAELASKYIDRVKRSALGGYEAPGGIHQVGAADIVEEALQSMGLDREQVRAMMGRYMAGGPGHTKRRLQLDLTAEHDNGVGGTFTLMDLFETNQLKLLRSQAGRVSGEVALAQHGVMGKAGLALLRRAMEFGDHGPASAKEFEAFDQMAAEFLGAPFGTAAGKYAERAMQLNSLARLGGMGFQQAAEYINGIVHVGAARTASAIAGMPRLRAEAAKLARGEKVDNPILSSLEVNGAEFGTHPYKMVFPFDEESHGSAQVYGQDTPTFLDRALRGASHVQAKLSFWRAIHGAQHRGFAEQIVHKAMRFVREGGDDIALNDMGIGKDLRDKLAAELPAIAEFNGDGSLQRFDITKMKDTQAAAEFIQAVHRGTNQIIQGTFIGETGKWAHSGFLRLLTQFRSFGIASVEKQWGRQVGNHGTAAALGMVLGSMSIAAPIYMAKVALNAQGRKDKQAYLDRMLTASAIASATLNLVSTTGLANDFLDATKAVTGLGTGSGGRAGQGSDLIGGVVAPAAGLMNDLYKGVQNTKKGTNPHDLLKALPFSNLPGMTPAINGLFQN